MKNYLLPIIYLSSFTLLLSACTMNQAARHKAVCNELKSQLIFNGATANTRQAEIENAEQPLTQSNYNSANCD